MRALGQIIDFLHGSNRPPKFAFEFTGPLTNLRPEKPD